MNNSGGNHFESETEKVVSQLARQGSRANELVEQAARILGQPVGQVRKLIQNSYPGLMTKSQPERRLTPERPDPKRASRDKVRTKGSGVYDLPARKRQGGHTF